MGLGSCGRDGRAYLIDPPQFLATSEYFFLLPAFSPLPVLSDGEWRMGHGTRREMVFSRHSFNFGTFRHLPMLFGAKMRPNYKNYETRGLELACANPLLFATPLYLPFCFFFGPFRFLANPKYQMPEEHWDMINAKWPMPPRQCQMANAKWPMPNRQ